MNERWNLDEYNSPENRRLRNRRAYLFIVGMALLIANNFLVHSRTLRWVFLVVALIFLFAGTVVGRKNIIPLKRREPNG